MHLVACLPFAPSLLKEVMQAPSLEWVGQQGLNSLAYEAYLYMVLRIQAADSAHLASGSGRPAHLDDTLEVETSGVGIYGNA